MARGGGSVQDGLVYHLISRFVAKEWFIESARERRVYLSLLGLALSQTDWRLFCFAIMSSHIHLGLVAGTEPLAAWLRPLHTRFAQWLNEQRQRIGAVFVKGPNVIGVEPAGPSRLINYVHRNPVRAGVVAHPSDSDWTSHRAYLGLAHTPRWLNVELGLELAGFADGSALGAWTDRVKIGRRDLEDVQVLRRNVGRPAQRVVELPATATPQPLPECPEGVVAAE